MDGAFRADTSVAASGGLRMDSFVRFRSLDPVRLRGAYKSASPQRSSLGDLKSADFAGVCSCGTHIPSSPGMIGPRSGVEVLHLRSPAIQDVGVELTYS